MFRAVFSRRTWFETTYLLLDLPVGVAGFTVVVTGLSLGLGLLITLIGVPILTLTVLACRAAIRPELFRARLLGLELAPPPRLDSSGGFLRRLVRPLGDGAGWRAAAYFILMLPVGIATFTIAVTWWATALGLLTLPAWAWSVPHGGPQIGNSTYWNEPWQLALACLAGVVLTLIAPWAIRALGAVDREIVRAFLGTSRRTLERRAAVLEESRSRTVDATIEDRRRLERDLHDGAQQRLVSLGMDLGIALEKLDSDPEQAKSLLQDAHGDAQLALARTPRPRPRHPPCRAH